MVKSAYSFATKKEKTENCYPMIPSGKPHNQMLLGKQDEEDEISEEGKVLV